MASFVAEHQSRLCSRHYIRKATASNHWFDFAEARVREYQLHFGSDFCLVVNGSDYFDDAYVVPFTFAITVFKPEYLDERHRWVGTIVGDNLKLGRANYGYPVAEYRNAFHLLAM